MTFYAGADRIRPELQVRPGLVVFFESDLADRVGQDRGLLGERPRAAARCQRRRRSPEAG